MIEKMYIRPILKSKKLNKYLIAVLLLMGILALNIKYFCFIADVSHLLALLLPIACVALACYIIKLMCDKILSISNTLFDLTNINLETKEQAFAYLARFFIGIDNIALNSLVNKAASDREMDTQELNLIVYAIISNNLDREGKTNHE